MKYLLLALVPTLALGAGDYQPTKQTAERAETYCNSIMLMTKRSEDALDTLRNVRVRVTGHHIDGRKAVIARYPYNMKGAGFMCGFINYGRGELKLRNFGEIWPGRKNLTQVEPLR